MNSVLQLHICSADKGEGVKNLKLFAVLLEYPTLINLDTCTFTLGKYCIPALATSKVEHFFVTAKYSFFVQEPLRMEESVILEVGLGVVNTA